MGFTVPAPESVILDLHFDAYPGLEVRAASISIETAMSLSGEEAITAFGNALRSWNCERPDGTPVPATLDGFRSLETRFGKALVTAWVDAITGVPAPLDQPSIDGLPWEAGSIPTEVLSGSLAS